MPDLKLKNKHLTGEDRQEIMEYIPLALTNDKYSLIIVH